MIRSVYIIVCLTDNMDTCTNCGQGKYIPLPSGRCQLCLAKEWVTPKKVEKLGIKELEEN